MKPVERPILRILFEDNHVLAIDKPAGVPVQADQSLDPSINDLVKADLKARYGKPGNVFATAVHRLDRPASGIVLVAKTSKAASRLSAAFREDRVDKTYLAVVEAVRDVHWEKIEGWMVKDRSKNTSRMVAEDTAGAKFASLSFKSLGRFGEFTLLQVKLKTGRSHQVRVQLAYAGMPLAGDKRYGARSAFGKMIGLHAASVVFPHPTKDEQVSVIAEPPASWEEVFGKNLFSAAIKACGTMNETV